MSKYEDITMWTVTNNFNYICDDCLSEIKEMDLYQPSFRNCIGYGECELCGYTKLKEEEL